MWVVLFLVISSFGWWKILFFEVGIVLGVGVGVVGVGVVVVWFFLVFFCVGFSFCVEVLLILLLYFGSSGSMGNNFSFSVNV